MNAENRAKGVTEDDAVLIDKRIESMGLSFARVSIPWSMWNPAGDRTAFTCDSDGMQSLYRHRPSGAGYGRRIDEGLPSR